MSIFRARVQNNWKEYALNIGCVFFKLESFRIFREKLVFVLIKRAIFFIFYFRVSWIIFANFSLAFQVCSIETFFVFDILDDYKKMFRVQVFWSWSRISGIKVDLFVKCIKKKETRMWKTVRKFNDVKKFGINKNTWFYIFKEVPRSEIPYKKYPPLEILFMVRLADAWVKNSGKWNFVPTRVF